MCHSEICGMHDLIIHDYGPGRVFASVHAEVPDDSNFVHVHEVIDEIERSVFDATGVQLVIHMDPVTVNNEHVDCLKKLVTDTLKGIDTACSIHDFRITDGEDRINVIFDIVIQDTYSADDRNKIVEVLKKQIKEKDPRLNLVVTIDEVYA